MELQNLTDVPLTNQIEEIGVGAFAGCSQLAQINIPRNDKYTKIENETFWGCQSLINVEIPDSMVNIGDRAFMGCKK